MYRQHLPHRDRLTEFDMDERRREWSVRTFQQIRESHRPVLERHQDQARRGIPAAISNLEKAFLFRALE